jgi:mannose-1-phosphate guanylyltransferase
MQPALYAVIMAGGSGTRFWPASRRSRPKQFLAVAGQQPMLTATRERLGALVPDERVLVVAGEHQADLVREALPGLPPENLLLEPCARNTLPCVALAAAEIQRRDPDSVQAVLPADHVIAPVAAFQSSLQAAAQVALEEQRLVTFGIKPTFPATGYGYIEVGEPLEQRADWKVHEVARFVEKPGEQRAREYQASGRFLWNSGMFVWRSADIAAALAEHAPQTWEALRDASGDGLAAAYDSVASEPIDVGVMERAERRAVIPVDYGWSDVGAWTAVADVVPADDQGNHLVGGGMLEALSAKDNIVWSDGGKLTALIGVEGLVVVRAGDAVLVCPRERAQQIKQLVERLPEDWR